MASEPLGEIRFVTALRKGQRAHEVVQQVWAQTLELPNGKATRVPQLFTPNHVGAQ